MNIAIVDDEEKWINLAFEVIDRFKGQKDKIYKYKSGLDFLADKNLIFDLIFIDVNMPDKNGFEIISEYKFNNNDVIVIILSTYLEYARKGYLINAFRYIDKTNMELEIEEAFKAIELNNIKKYLYRRKN